MNRSEWFSQLCEQSVTQTIPKKYGLKLDRCEQASNTKRLCSFVNDYCGVIFELGSRDRYIEIIVSTLDENGEFSSKVGPVMPDSEFTSIYFSNILVLRGGSTEGRMMDGSIPLEEQIVERCKELKKYGKDVLSGDFSVFSEATELIKKRQASFLQEREGKEYAISQGWAEYLDDEAAEE